MFNDATMLILWIKIFHILFVIAWFAGLFYLPRIYVNLAQQSDAAVQACLLGMARRLYRFTTIMAIPALILGAILYGVFGIGKGFGWIHAKLGFVILVIGYHHACGVMLRKFSAGRNTRSHVFYRWFNEVPLVLLLAILILVILKPF